MDEDTHEFDPVVEDGAPWSYPVNRHDAEDVDTGIEPKEPKVPEPALVRAFLVALVGLVSAVVGKTLDVSWIDPFLAVYAISAPVVLGWWIRNRVTPVKK